MAGSPSSVLDPGGRRRLSNSRAEPPPRQREKVGGLFSADGVAAVCGAVSQLPPVPVVVGDVLELCRKSAVSELLLAVSPRRREITSTRRTICNASGWRISEMLSLGC